MAFLYQKTFCKTDPRSGEKLTRKRKKWRIRYRDAEGVTRDIAGFNDKIASKQLAAELERMVARQKVGLVDKFHEHRKRPLLQHLSDFEAHLGAKGNTEKHVKLKVGRIKAALEGCRFASINDLVPSRLEQWLADRRADVNVRMSFQTSNHHLTCVKGFARWLVMERRMADNPFIGLKGLNVKLDPRHERRVLNDEDLGEFLVAAANGKPFRGLAGPDRLMLYRLVLYTGLRCNEAARLTPEAFDLKEDTPTVTVKAGYSKRRKQDVLTLRDDLATELKRWLRRKSKGERVWPGTWHKKASVMVKRDLESAGLKYRDAATFVFDFHALRHQFVSSLARAGVHPATAQRMARHSDINLTLTRYTHIGREDEKRAVEALPGLNGAKLARAPDDKAVR